LFTDWGFFYGIVESIELQAKLAPVYFYLYKFKLPVGLGALWGNRLAASARSGLGTVHGDDVLLIYSTPAHAGSEFKYSEDEVKMTKHLLAMYDETFLWF
jgi:carboxylesterase type B